MPGLRVLQVIPSVSSKDGGPSRAIGTIERALTKVGASVTTLTTDADGPGSRLSDDRRPGKANGADRIYKRKWIDFYKIAPGVVPWLWRNVRRFDVVHVHALFSFTSVAAATISALRGVPFIIRPLGTLADFGLRQRRPRLKAMSLALIEGPLLRRAAFVHCTSRAELEEINNLGIPLRGGVIPLGVEAPARPRQRPCRRRATPDSGPPVLLFLSRIDPKKNLEGLLRALASVAQTRPDLILNIAGDGPADHVASMRALAANLSISDRVRWLGHLEDEAKTAAFEAADIFVLPSFSENFGIAAVEAMLAGLPCILGREVAIAEEAKRQGACVTVEPRPESIAAALVQLLDDFQGRRRMGDEARAWAEREYCCDAAATRLMEIYSTLGPRMSSPG